MKVASICAYSMENESGLKNILKTVYKTFGELGVDVIEADLKDYNLPYYEGSSGSYEEAEKIMRYTISADAIIFAFSVEIFAPCARLKNFFEYFNHKSFSGILKGKRIMVVAYADLTGEREATYYCEKVIESFGGAVPVHLTVCKKALLEMHSSGNDTAFIEKSVEDYYRIVRQNRAVIFSGDYYLHNQMQTETQTVPVKNLYEDYADYASPSMNNEYAQKEINYVPNSVVSKETGKLLDSAHKDPEKDIEELSKLFSLKLNADTAIKDKPDNFNSPGITYKRPVGAPFMTTKNEPLPTVRKKTVKQMTQNLPHYFQPQLSADTNAIIQINVMGSETFDGFLTIKGGECLFNDGITEDIDLYIIVSAVVWEEVLSGKQTAQKAFMTGKLKVRGNFMLLNKFDQLFKLA